jgi:beta-glucosidase
VTPDGDIPNQIRKGLVGSLLNVIGAERTREFQDLAMQSRLRIPLLFGQDVIHGYKTTFPIPLVWGLPQLISFLLFLSFFFFVQD